MTGFPAKWHSIRIGGLFRRRNERGRSDLPLLSVYRDFGVVPREGREDNFNRPGEDLDAYRVVRPGDLVLNKMKTWQGSLGISAHEGIVSPAYFVAKQSSEADARFLHHLLRSRPLIAEYGARSKGIRPSQWDLPWDEFKDIRIALPPAEEQRAIADFLDRETARVDALITKKRQMMTSLTEWRESKVLDSVLDWRRVKSRTLRQYGTRVLTGPFGTLLAASEYIEGGVPLINPTHISDGKLVAEAQVSVPEEVAIRLSRYRLRRGDLVMGRKGDAGRAAIVPPGAEGWICGSDSIAIRTNPDLLRTGYLAAVLSLSMYRQQLEAHSTGATIANVNESVLLRLKVPDLPLHEQDRVIGTADEVNALFLQTRNRVQAQILLLREHRQALTNAAVTGQMDIHSAA